MTFGAEARQRLLAGAGVSALVFVLLAVLVTQEAAWLHVGTAIDLTALRDRGAQPLVRARG